MGDPAEVSPQDRLSIRSLAARVVESVKADEPMAHGLDVYTEIRNRDCLVLTDAEDLIFRLCEEVVRLRGDCLEMATLVLCGVHDEDDEKAARKMQDALIGAPTMTKRRPITVDTGGLNDVFPGALVTWLHTPRGGYGYTMPIDARVISHARRPRTWVRIEVLTRDRHKVERRVDIKNLRWRF